MRRRTNFCPQCIANPRPGQRYCLACHARYLRKWRKTHPMTDEQRTRANARSYAHVYRDKGKIKRQPCRECSSPKAEMHHGDYSRALDVVWLCRDCHLALHAGCKSNALGAAA